MAGTTTYGSISPGTAGAMAAELLKNASVHLVLNRYGQGKPLDKNATKTKTFRRYTALDTTPKYLQEGVTPAATKLTKTDIEFMLQQIGDLVEITDVVADTHTDPVLSEARELMEQQAPEMIERILWGELTAGTSVFYANGAARDEVNTPINGNLIKAVTRLLKRQRAKTITKMLGASANYGTVPVPASYLCVGHTDMEQDVRDLPGFVSAETYATPSPHPEEIGKVGSLRFLLTPLYDLFEDAGGDAGDDVVSTTGVKADVYPLIVFGENAYGSVPLKGKSGVKVYAHNPDDSDKSDPLGQRGYAGWKSYTCGGILNEAWICRIEAAVSKLT